MTDRELLEAAAKAAGQERSVAGDLWSNARGMLWSPLTDDGDALRLANKLWIEVLHVHGKAHAGKTSKFWCTEAWFPDGDQDAATRRAIVRAAAAMAESK